jgi:hypothetical protein
MPITLAMPFRMTVGLFAPASTFANAGGVPWQFPQELLAYRAFPLIAEVTGAGLVTLNVRLTIGAAAKVVLPDWFAVTMQLPAAKDVNTLPVTVHTDGVVLAKTTGRPELALAVSDIVAPTVCGPGEAKVIVCAVGMTPELGATVNVLVTLTAALYVAFPLWFALRLQVPDASNTKVLPLTVQTTGVLDVIETARPELEVATNAGVAKPMVWLPGDAKVMVWVVNGGTFPPVNPKAIKVAMSSAATTLITPAKLLIPPSFSRIASMVFDEFTASGIRGPWQLWQFASYSALPACAFPGFPVLVLNPRVS